MEQIKKAIQSVAGEVEFDISRPDEKFGDYATNAALKIAAKTGKNPRETAEVLASNLEGKIDGTVAIAGPGFINITLSDSALLELVKQKPAQIYDGKTIVIEHTDPNPFKEFHIGHAYSNTIGEALGRLYKIAGAKVHQVSYHGDAGLHIAMAIWGMKKQGSEPPAVKKHEFLAKSYALGSKANKEDTQAAAEIREINKHIYLRDDKEISKLYDTGRQWSFAYFDEIYKKLNVSFEKQYFETETGKIGQEVVEKHTKVFEKSDNAIVYRGEKHGLHTRVFITRENLPTYETKELGLAYLKQKDYPHAQTFMVVTANEIDEYFKVVVSALKEIDPKLAGKIQHVSHGVVKLPGGKMSSRTGEVITLEHLLKMLEAEYKKVSSESNSTDAAVAGALKYAFLSHRIGGDIVFNIEESVAIEGNSGPYLQYAYARANSILHKGRASSKKTAEGLEPDERSLLRKISEFTEVVDTAARELLPSHICTYLHELAQTFNRFYEKNRVLDDSREAVRLQLVKFYADTLKNGLELLNIPVPEKM